MNVSIDADTQLLCVIGDPISHSLSPLIHNTVYTHLGLNAIYFHVEVSHAQLLEFLSATRIMRIHGFNCTMPHKHAILPHLHTLTASAQAAQSVNTVRIAADGLHGHSTDGIGFSRALFRHALRFCGARVLILGSGGAAGAIAIQAALEGAEEITLLNRTAAHAEAIRELVRASKPEMRVRVCALNEQTLQEQAGRCTLCINATPMGMQGKPAFETLSFLERLHKDAAVCDLIYHPLETALLTRAHQLGLPCVNGIGMLVYQALSAIEFLLDTPIEDSLFDVCMHALHEKLH